MLTPEQIQSMALSHGFYPDANFTELVRAIERAAREDSAAACEKYAHELTRRNYDFSPEPEDVARFCAARIRTGVK
jgi:hypothetical protein